MTGARGFTLVELLVVLVIIGITYGSVGLAVRSVPSGPEEPPAAELAAARRQAVRTNAAVTISVATDASVMLYPDGSATPVRFRAPDGLWRIDPWTAELRRVE